MPQIDVLKLFEYFENSKITKFEYSIDNEKIVLEKNLTATATPIVQTAPVVSNIPVISNETVLQTEMENDFVKVKAPLVGVFYQSPSPDDKPFVSVGDTVKKGQTLCLLEAMKMMSEISSPVNGVIKSILCQNEAVVGFDEVLFEVLEC